MDGMVQLLVLSTGCIVQRAYNIDILLHRVPQESRAPCSRGWRFSQLWCSLNQGLGWPIGPPHLLRSLVDGLFSPTYFGDFTDF